MTVGVLAIQGCVEQHIEHLKRCKVNSRRVRTPEDLESLDRIILPGGESSTMLLLLKKCGLWEKLKQFVNEKPAWGICAGAILLAKEVESPKQDCLQAIPIRAHRNFYGSQLNSFHAEIEIKSLGKKMPVDFIRAPKLEPLSKDCEILGKFQDSAVLIKHKKTLVSSFHTELGEDSSLHQLFIKI